MSSRAFVMHADVLTYFGARLEVVHLTYAKWSYSICSFNLSFVGSFLYKFHLMHQSLQIQLVLQVQLRKKEELSY